MKQKKSLIKKSKNVLSNNSIIVGRDLHVGDKFNLSTSKKHTNSTPNAVSTLTAIREEIAKDKIKKAIKMLLIFPKLKDEDLRNEILHQSRRWNHLKKKERLGTISDENAGLTFNRIIKSLLEIINDLEAQ